MKQSENISNLAKALVIAQSNIQSGVLKNQKNDVFDSGYADLGAVINACKSALNDAGIFVIQSPTASSNNGFVHLTTRLIHESGEWIEDTATAPMVHLDPQGFGSAISYMRRYALASMVGLYQADDDDGDHDAGERFLVAVLELVPDELAEARVLRQHLGGDQHHPRRMVGQ